MVLGPDVPQHGAGGPDGPGGPVPGQHRVPAALPPAAISSGDVRPGTEPLGLPAQRLRQEKPLPLQVRLLPVYFLLTCLLSIRVIIEALSCICLYSTMQACTQSECYWWKKT